MGKPAIQNKLVRRVFVGWNFQRILILILGLIYLVSSIFDYTIVGILFSIFITGQAIFGYGCAGGTCPID